MGNEGSPQGKKEDKPKQSNRTTIFFIICLIVFFILFHFIYGFDSRFFHEDEDQAKKLVPEVLMSSLFTLLGFGLVLAPFRNTPWSGLTIALFVVSFNFLLGPLIHEMWFTAFLYRYTGDASIIAPQAEEYFEKGAQDEVVPNSLSFRLANLCSVSFFISVSGYIGRINLPSIFQSLTIFNILWYLNINLLVQMSFLSNPLPLTFLDDYGTDIVFLFGAAHGLIACIINRGSIKTKQFNSDIISVTMSMLGTAFLFSSFLFMSTNITHQEEEAANFKENAGAANIFLSLLGSVCGTYVGSVFVNKGKMGVKEATLGTIVGAIMAGAGSGYIENMGVAVALGAIAGLFAGIMLALIPRKLNKETIFDSSGFILPVLLISFLGGFVAFPVTIIRYFTLSETYESLGTLEKDDWQAAGYQLAYCGVSLGIGLFAGLLSGFLQYMGRHQATDFSDWKIFSQDYGLFETENKPQDMKKKRKKKEQKAERKKQEKKESKVDETKDKKNEDSQKQLYPELV